MFDFRFEVDYRNKRFPGQDSETVKSLVAKVERQLRGIRCGFECQKHVCFHEIEAGKREKGRNKLQEMSNIKIISNGI